LPVAVGVEHPVCISFNVVIPQVDSGVQPIELTIDGISNSQNLYTVIGPIATKQAKRSSVPSTKYACYSTFKAA
jgi:hypothetical protein